MKRKPLYILLALLLITNMALLVLILNDGGKVKKGPMKPHFLTEELNFSEAQTKQFTKLDRSHRQRMMKIDDEMRDLKDQLFSSFQSQNNTSDSITERIGKLTVKRDKELVQFFGEVRKICTPGQVKDFDRLIKRALRGGGPPPPPRDHDRRPPPRDF